MRNPGLFVDVRDSFGVAMGVHEGIYFVGIDYVSEGVYIVEMACGDELSLLGCFIGVGGRYDCY